MATKKGNAVQEEIASGQPSPHVSKEEKKKTEAIRAITQVPPWHSSSPSRTPSSTNADHVEKK